MKATVVLLALFVGLMTMGFSCVNDNALISVNISGLTGTYNINPGGTTFSERDTVRAADYLDIGFDNIDLNTTRIYDVRVSTIGTFGGNISGQVFVNGTLLLSIVNQPWASFNTPQSLITSSLLSRNALGIMAIITAIRGKQDIILFGSGTVSQAVPSGLALKVEVFAQIDAEL